MHIENRNISCCQVLGDRGGEGITANVYRIAFGDNEIDCGDSWATINTLKNH